MALLYRFTRVNDRANTGVFTFIVTRSVTRDLYRDATTKEFSFGHHRWVVSFNRSDAKMLGVHLILRNASAGTRCFVDFAFSLLNREHFSKNETYYEKQCRFNADQPAQGPSKWVLMSELHSRKFSDENGEFLMDLTLSNPLTVFETDVRVTHFPFVAATHHKTGTIETPYFQFGGYEWNVAVHPQGLPDEQETTHRPKVLLNRLTGFDHQVRVQYRIVLGDGDRTADSGILDQISDMTGRIRGFALRCTLGDVLRRGVLRVYVEMYLANSVSEVSVVVGREPNVVTPNCYDREKQAWCVEADLEAESIKLKLFCADLRNVPRNHLRYVSWYAYVIKDQSQKQVDLSSKENCLCALNGPHCNYYMQDGMDMGIVMETDIPITTVDELAILKADSTAKSICVQIEWLDSLLLFSATYHKYDDVCRLQCHQMKREISALQAENYSLERQLFSYQKSISLVNSRGQTSEDNQDEEDEEEGDPDGRTASFYSRRTILASEGQSFSETEYT